MIFMIYEPSRILLVGVIQKLVYPKKNPTKCTNCTYKYRGTSLNLLNGFGPICNGDYVLYYERSKTHSEYLNYILYIYIRKSPKSR